MTDSWPVTLRFQKLAQQLAIDFEDGEQGIISYRFLREESPSAEVQGHGRGPKPEQPPVPEDISVDRAEHVGRYAVRIVFSDGHDSGLYTWRLLQELAERQRAIA